MTVQVNVHEAKAQLSRLIEAVLAGEQVTIARAGKPVVDLVIHHADIVCFGVDGWSQRSVDPAIFDGTDDDIQQLFLGV